MNLDQIDDIKELKALRAKIEKKCFINARSPIIDGPLSERPDCGHDNPLKPNRTRVDASKKLGQWHRRRISANFPYPKGSISFDSFDFMANLQIGCQDRNY